MWNLPCPLIRMVDVSENVLDVLSPRLAKSKITPYENNLIIDEKIMFGKDYYV